MRERIEAGNIAAERQRERMNVTNEYDLPGYYTLDYEQAQSTAGSIATGALRARKSRLDHAQPGRPQHRQASLWAGQSAAGDCIVAANPVTANQVIAGRVYPVACWSDSQVSVGRAVQANGVTLKPPLHADLISFCWMRRKLIRWNPTVRGAKITLRRKRDLVPMGEVPLEGDYLLQLAYAGEYLRAHCTFDYTSDSKTYFRLNCIDDQGRNLQSSTIRSSTYPTALMLRVSGLAHFPSWQAKYNVQGRSIMLGGIALRQLVCRGGSCV